MDRAQSSEWYYVGHYGQLGPLTLDNIKELANDGVIDRDTFVWSPGMPDWTTAGNVPALHSLFARPQTPPPTPNVNPATFAPHTPPAVPTMTPHLGAHTPYGAPSMHWSVANYQVPKSDKNRGVAAVLCILPGVGRIYLGDATIGVLQLLTSPCAVGVIWSWIDGLYIMSGGLKHDGYGRELPD